MFFSSSLIAKPLVMLLIFAFAAPVYGQVKSDSHNHWAQQRDSRFGASNLRGERLNDDLKDAINQLIRDLQMIKDESDITQEQIDALRASLIAMLDEAQRPDRELVEIFFEDLADALADGTLDIEERLLLLGDLYDVLESANIEPDEFWDVADDVRVIGDASNVDRNDVILIINDVRAIIDALRR